MQLAAATAATPMRISISRSSDLLSESLAPVARACGVYPRDASVLAIFDIAIFPGSNSRVTIESGKQSRALKTPSHTTGSFSINQMQAEQWIPSKYRERAERRASIFFT